ncbi:MAG: aspartate aminotransferase family protein, partial [Desulfobacterales bacterium]
YDSLDKKSDRLYAGLVKAAENAGINVTGNRVGSMLGLFFTDREVFDFDDAKTCDLDMFSAYYNGMLEKGIYLAPSQFEALFVSAAHDTEHIDKTITAAEEVMKGLRK